MASATFLSLTANMVGDVAVPDNGYGFSATAQASMSDTVIFRGNSNAAEYVIVWSPSTSGNGTAVESETGVHGSFRLGIPINFSVMVYAEGGGPPGQTAAYATSNQFDILLYDASGQQISAQGVLYRSASGTEYNFSGATYCATCSLTPEPSTFFLLVGPLAAALVLRQRLNRAR